MDDNALTVIKQLIELARENGTANRVLIAKTFYGDLQRINKDYVSIDSALAEVKTQLKRIEKSEKTAAEKGVPYKVDEEYLAMLLALREHWQPPEPPKLTEDQLTSYFSNQIAKNPTINAGGLMRSLATNYRGQYDGKLAAGLAAKLTNKTDKFS